MPKDLNIVADSTIRIQLAQEYGEYFFHDPASYRSRELKTGRGTWADWVEFAHQILAADSVEGRRQFDSDGYEILPT